MQTGIFESFRKGVLSIWREEGIRGFYTGAIPTAARNVPFVVVTFTMFGSLEKFLLDKKNQNSVESGLPPIRSLSSWESLTIGVSAASVACLLTQPVDVIKTRMMTQAASNLPPYNSVLDCVSSILRNEGVSKFYAGLKPRYFYMAPLWALQFGLNNKIREHFRSQNIKKEL